MGEVAKIGWLCSEYEKTHPNLKNTHTHIHTTESLCCTLETNPTL